MQVFRITACAFIILVSLVCSAGTEYVVDEPKKAQVGQASRSSGMTFTPSVEIAFERARANAMARRDSALSAERVLIELLEEE